ncbi:hypothetical protein [Saccharothrix deserti]|uniref:hypothetical protein n=1 Tax=Saccharothrix deserti TaxID=2593674 RepID=UPI00131C2D3A|nr:hypothetical protein [Saccharothrix deserti]
MDSTTDTIGLLPEREQAPAFADRVATAERILRSRPQSSDRGVAATTGLASGTVAAIRSRSGTPAAARVGRDGRVRPVSCADGREAAGRYLTRNPTATLRAVAEAAGISVSTARDVRARRRRGENLVPARSRTGRPPTRVTRPAHTQGARAVLAVLRNDPSLRGGQMGRQFLRLLDAHAAVEDWQRLADTLPPHCADLMAGLAAECAGSWALLAAHLDRRQLAERA